MIIPQHGEYPFVSFYTVLYLLSLLPVYRMNVTFAKTVTGNSMSYPIQSDRQQYNSHFVIMVAMLMIGYVMGVIYWLHYIIVEKRIVYYSPYFDFDSIIGKRLDLIMIFVSRMLMRWMVQLLMQMVMMMFLQSVCWTDNYLMSVINFAAVECIHC